MSMSLCNITKSFKEKNVLNSFSLDISDGEILCIMGGSGIGKTTVINLILGLISPDSGTISGIKDNRFSVVFQEDRLSKNFSAIRNIKIVSPELPEDTIIKELYSVGLMDDDIHKPVSKLSGGMKRRVAIVRALLASSHVVIMDEPFKGLDTTTKNDIIKYTLLKRKNRTLIIITHDISECTSLGARVFNM